MIFFAKKIKKQLSDTQILSQMYNVYRKSFMKYTFKTLCLTETFYLVQNKINQNIILEKNDY